MTLFEQDKNMSSTEHNFELALEYAKSMKGYSNLARCYVELAKKAMQSKTTFVTSVQTVEPTPDPEPVKTEEPKPLHVDPTPQPKKRGRPPKTEPNTLDL